jgi:hypothetical protein
LGTRGRRIPVGLVQPHQATEGTRVFSEAELRDFSRGNVQLALEALDRGDPDTARYWCRQEAATHCDIHDVFVATIAGLFSYIYDELGEEAAVEAVRTKMANNTIKLLELRTSQGPREWVGWCVDQWRQHREPPGLTVEEDDEKFTLTVHCGSGAKLVERGAYDGPDGFRRLQKPGPHTFGETGMPIYCSHCSWAHELMPIATLGQGSQFWVHADRPFPVNPGDPCIHYIYKHVRDIPDRHYERLGLKKIEERDS